MKLKFNNNQNFDSKVTKDIFIITYNNLNLRLLPKIKLQVK